MNEQMEKIKQVILVKRNLLFLTTKKSKFKKIFVYTSILFSLLILCIWAWIIFKIPVLTKMDKRGIIPGIIIFSGFWFFNFLLLILNFICNKKYKKMTKIDYSILYFNDEDYINVQKINFKKFFIDDKDLKNLLKVKIKKIEINNVLAIAFKNKEINISYNYIYYDFEKEEFKINLVIRSLEQLIVKNLNELIIDNFSFNDQKNAVQINLKLCNLQEICKISPKNKKNIINTSNLNYEDKIPGLFLQKKYNKKNYLEMYSSIIKENEKIIENLIYKFF